MGKMVVVVVLVVIVIVVVAVVGGVLVVVVFARVQIDDQDRVRLFVFRCVLSPFVSI